MAKHDSRRLGRASADSDSQHLEVSKPRCRFPPRSSSSHVFLVFFGYTVWYLMLIAILSGYNALTEANNSPSTVGQRIRTEHQPDTPHRLGHTAF